ncbi:hypothetical protein JXD38_04210 [candidate division WOR-3 bacterium]|nr:hypothetical protein [candidate division WOR-3 bacterium]
MKRSIIAVAALLLLLSSATYASPPRPARRHPRFWSSVLCWLGFGHHRGPAIVVRPKVVRPRVVVLGPRRHSDNGWHWGWRNGRHYSWNRKNDRNHRGRPGDQRPHDGEHGRGRGGDRR